MKIWEIDRSCGIQYMDNYENCWEVDGFGDLILEGLDITKQFNLSYILCMDFTPLKKFSEDEKTILRNISPDFKHISRNKDGDLCLYKETSDEDLVVVGITLKKYYPFRHFNHLFKSIPCDSEHILIKDIVK